MAGGVAIFLRQPGYRSAKIIHSIPEEPQLINENLYALLQSRFPPDRSQPAIETESGRIYSYAELESVTASYAGFIQSLGVVPGDRVAVQVEKSPEALFLYLACLKAGAVYLPLNSAYQEGEIDYFLGDAEPKIFVHQPKSVAWATALCGKRGIVHQFVLLADDENAPIGSGSRFWSKNALGAPPMLEIVQRKADDLAAILYTSGTTGRSKGAMITHKNMASNAVTPATVPGAPVIGIAIAGNGQAVVTFSAPSSNGALRSRATRSPPIAAASPRAARPLRSR